VAVVTRGRRGEESSDHGDEGQGRRAAAFGAIVAAHCDRLCRYVCRYVRSREAAEDIVQEVFLRLWERGSDQQIREPLPYLYQAAHNRAISYLRHQRVRSRWEELATRQPAPVAEATHAALEHDDLARAIDRATDALPERCRQVFLLSRDQQLSHAEIAGMLGLSVKTVESHVWRAITAIRSAIKPYLEQ